jgi:VanZ family protein
VVLWAAVIFTFSAIPSLGTGLGTWDFVLRKLAHMTEYAVLAALLARAARNEPRAFVLAVAYAVTDELHQSFVRGREGRPLDVAIDAAGALAGLVVWRRVSSRGWSAKT